MANIQAIRSKGGKEHNKSYRSVLDCTALLFSKTQDLVRRGRASRAGHYPSRRSHGVRLLRARTVTPMYACRRSSRHRRSCGSQRLGLKAGEGMQLAGGVSLSAAIVLFCLTFTAPSLKCMLLSSCLSTTDDAVFFFERETRDATTGTGSLLLQLARGDHVP